MAFHFAAGHRLKIGCARQFEKSHLIIHRKPENHTLLMQTCKEIGNRASRTFSFASPPHPWGQVPRTMAIIPETISPMLVSICLPFGRPSLISDYAGHSLPNRLDFRQPRCCHRDRNEKYWSQSLPLRFAWDQQSRSRGGPSAASNPASWMQVPGR